MSQYIWSAYDVTPLAKYCCIYVTPALDPGKEAYCVVSYVLVHKSSDDISAKGISTTLQIHEIRRGSHESHLPKRQPPGRQGTAYTAGRPVEIQRAVCVRPTVLSYQFRPASFHTLSCTTTRASSSRRIQRNFIHFAIIFDYVCFFCVSVERSSDGEQGVKEDSYDDDVGDIQ